MRDAAGISRRALLTGAVSRLHISSAVVIALPDRREQIRNNLQQMSGVEVHAEQGSRLVVTIEGSSSGMLGETLTTISLLEGVVSANMVYEHSVDGEQDA